MYAGGKSKVSPCTQNWLAHRLRLADVLLDTFGDAAEFAAFLARVDLLTGFSSSAAFVAHAVQQLFVLSADRLCTKFRSPLPLALVGDEAGLFALLFGRCVFGADGRLCTHLLSPLIVYLSMSDEFGAPLDASLAPDALEGALERACEYWHARSFQELVSTVATHESLNLIFFVVDRADALIALAEHMQRLFESLVELHVPVLLASGAPAPSAWVARGLNAVYLPPLEFCGAKRTLQLTAAAQYCRRCNPTPQACGLGFLAAFPIEDAFALRAAAPQRCTHALLDVLKELCCALFDSRLTRSHLVYFLMLVCGGFRSALVRGARRLIYLLASLAELRAAAPDSGALERVDAELFRVLTLAEARDFCASAPRALNGHDLICALLGAGRPELRLFSGLAADFRARFCDAHGTAEHFFELCVDLDAELRSALRKHRLAPFCLPNFVHVVDTALCGAGSALLAARQLTNAVSAVGEPFEKYLTRFEPFDVVVPPVCNQKLSCVRDLSVFSIYKYNNCLNELLWSKTALSGEDCNQRAFFSLRSLPFVLPALDPAARTAFAPEAAAAVALLLVYAPPIRFGPLHHVLRRLLRERSAHWLETWLRGRPVVFPRGGAPAEVYLHVDSDCGALPATPVCLYRRGAIFVVTGRKPPAAAASDAQTLHVFLAQYAARLGLFCGGCEYELSLADAFSLKLTAPGRGAVRVVL